MLAVLTQDWTDWAGDRGQGPDVTVRPYTLVVPGRVGGSRALCLDLSICTSNSDRVSLRLSSRCCMGKGLQGDA